MYIAGSQRPYQWLVTDDEQFDIVETCPEIVLGKYVAITSIDSGVLLPNETEQATGWQSRGQIAYSPRVQVIATLPRGGWDEWYIFDKPFDLGTSYLGENVFEVSRGPGHVSVFVNYCFTFHRPEDKALALMFWEQMEWIRPESYIGDNDFLNFATVNQALFERVHRALKALT